MSVAGSRRTAEGALEAKDAADNDAAAAADDDEAAEEEEEEEDGEEGRRSGSVGGADAVAIAWSLDQASDQRCDRRFGTRIPMSARASPSARLQLDCSPPLSSLTF